MDFTPILGQVFHSFWYLIPLLLIAAVVKSPWFKGVMGEAIVNISAKYFLNREDYHLIKNVTLPVEDGTTQIDHIIVSRFGIFVIETKNMKGWIFGDAKQKTWTQKIYKHTTKFQNPLHQNYKHVKALETLLELDSSLIHSVIVFVGDSTFKTPMPENVTQAGGYIKHIKSMNQQVLDTRQVADAIERIRSGRKSASFKTSREHVKHVKSIVTEKANSNACPKCGSLLILRTVKSGVNAGSQFKGCTKFPACRYTTKFVH
ncbi:NERD domain-containing protein [Glaciimonas sp. Gout2]|uniref:nuclease-related domain-containing protein n=1 Tax=unclassified Glaciimonas TaxID=2644401 RepID=UPI002B22EBE1|nr:MULTISPECIES: NERD domain-containing protein [unclassified Glaciimonas]MEB0012277.1 NERD domain-containing protein [Glaciimonas sp. Cout2]MEB0080535.1 NERD domain-containing protein [Glaciimonas sp. Gout2]